MLFGESLTEDVSSARRPLGLVDRRDPLGDRPRPSCAEGLTTRDLDVLRLLADGRTTADMARAMAYSESTVKQLVHAVLGTIGARNRAHAVALAIRSGLI